MDSQRNIKVDDGAIAHGERDVEASELEGGLNEEVNQEELDPEALSGGEIESQMVVKDLNLEAGEGPDATVEQIAESLSKQPDALKDLQEKVPPEKLGAQSKSEDGAKDEEAIEDDKTRELLADPSPIVEALADPEGRKLLVESVGEDKVVEFEKLNDLGKTPEPEPEPDVDLVPESDPVVDQPAPDKDEASDSESEPEVVRFHPAPQNSDSESEPEVVRIHRAPKRSHKKRNKKAPVQPAPVQPAPVPMRSAAEALKGKQGVKGGDVAGNLHDTLADATDKISGAISTTHTDGKDNFGVSSAGPIWGDKEQTKDALGLKDDASGWAPADTVGALANAPGAVLQGIDGVKNTFGKDKSVATRAKGVTQIASAGGKATSVVTKATYATRQMVTGMSSDDGVQTSLKKTSDGSANVADAVDFVGDTIDKGERFAKFYGRKVGRKDAKSSTNTKARRAAVFTRESLAWAGKGLKAAISLSKFAGEGAQTFATVGGQVAGGVGGVVAIFDYALALRKIHRSGKQLRNVVRELQKKDLSNGERKALRQVAEIANKKMDRGLLEGTMASLRFGAAALTASGFGAIVGMSVGAALALIEGAITATRMVKQWGRDRKAKKIATRENRLTNRKKELADVEHELDELNRVAQVGSRMNRTLNSKAKSRLKDLTSKQAKLKTNVAGKERKISHANMRRVMHEWVLEKKASTSSDKAVKDYADFDKNFWGNVITPYLNDQSKAAEIAKLSLPDVSKRDEWREQWKKYMGKGSKGVFSFNEFKSTVEKKGNYLETARTVLATQGERQHVMLKGLDIDSKKWPSIQSEKHDDAVRLWAKPDSHKAKKDLKDKGATDAKSARQVLLEEYLVEVMGRR